MLAHVLSSVARMTARDIKMAYHLDKLIIGSVIFFFVISWSTFLKPSLQYIRQPKALANPIFNSTLGFEKIFALTLVGREDRTRPLLAAGNATNLTITALDGIRDVQIPQRSWPAGWKPEQHRGGELGCLVSHVQAWHKMISDGVSTALILESDADWDLRIKSIMPDLATGVRAIVDWPFTTAHHTQDQSITPYGDGWDILWIGHCGSNHNGNVRSYYWNDTTVPPKTEEFTYDSGLTKEQHIPGTRAVFQFGRTTCTSGYAISLPGATKLVQYFRESNENVDLRLSSVCTKSPDMTCLGVWPQIITAAVTKSNIDHSAGGGDDAGGSIVDDEDEAVEAGPALQFPARPNAKQILENGAGVEDWVAEWETTWGIKDGVWDIIFLNRTEII